jgi:two-component system NarL family sensor kinase
VVLPAVVALLCATAALLRVGAATNYSASGDLTLWAFELAAAISAALLGGWLVHGSRGSGTGWLLQLGALALAVSTLTDNGAVLPGTWEPAGAATASVQLWANVLSRVLLLAAAVVALPDRVGPGRGGAGTGTALVAALVVGGTAGALLHGRTEELRDSDVGFGNRAWVDAADAVPSGVLLGLLAVHVASLLLLARRRAGADPSSFQVLGWGLAVAALPAALPAVGDRLPQEWPALLATAALPLLPVVSVVAVLRAISWTVDRLVSRTIVWGLLSVGVVLVQAVAVAVAALAGGRAGFLVSVAVTVVAAAGFQAARRRLQRLVDRLVFGAGRDRPEALTELGRRMESALGPDDVLPELAAALVAAYGGGVLVTLDGADGPQVVARAGAVDTGGASHEWPLVHRGERVGALTARAPASAPFRASDLESLAHLAGQVAVAAYGVRTSLELRRSQTALVTAVEEERRRLQRDLHDGLGPALAGVALGLRAVRNQLADASGADPEPLLRRLSEEVESNVEDVRRIVHDLRPVVLDQLGLVGAVRAFADRCSTGDLRVDLVAEDELPPLSAATEVAAYRITVEALTNALRHAGATRCTVRLTVEDDLLVEVEDDGTGLPDSCPAGVGLASMRQRSAGVGGSLLLSAGAAGGTRVAAHLPVGADRA